MRYGYIAYKKIDFFSTNVGHVILSRVMTFDIKALEKLKYMMDFIIVYYV
jgi:hypothetical protein